MPFLSDRDCFFLDLFLCGVKAFLFRVANDLGKLLRVDGVEHLETPGAINLPAKATSIEITGDGTIVADGLEVDQLRVVDFADKSRLQRVSGSSFIAPTGVEPTIP